MLFDGILGVSPAVAQPGIPSLAPDLPPGAVLITAPTRNEAQRGLRAGVVPATQLDFAIFRPGELVPRVAVIDAWGPRPVLPPGAVLIECPNAREAQIGLRRGVTPAKQLDFALYRPQFQSQAMASNGLLFGLSGARIAVIQPAYRNPGHSSSAVWFSAPGPAPVPPSGGFYFMVVIDD